MKSEMPLRFNTDNNDGTTTCGNGTLVVTLPTNEFNHIGCQGVFDKAMQVLGNRSEAQLSEKENVSLAEVTDAARENLIFDYLSQNSNYNLYDFMMCLNGSKRMHPGMAKDMKRAEAYADGVLSPITPDDLVGLARDYYANNSCDTPEEGRKFERAMEIEALRLGDGTDASAVMAEAAACLERSKQNELQRRIAIGNTCSDWTIEIVGQMPKLIGRCRYAQQPEHYNP